MDSRKKLLLRKLFHELEGKRARHTELISVYIPSGYSITSVIQQLAQEQGTAENIKSKTTRKNVQMALEKMIRRLRTFPRTPPNGLAIFSGNVAETEGGQDFLVRSVEPPEPISVKIYKCAQEFFLEPLRDLIAPKKTYGLLVIDRQEANIALLRGTSILPVHDEESFVPGKTHKGGQSAARYARVRENMAKDFFRKIAEIATKIFSQEKQLSGILVGGPGPTKETFVSNFLPIAIREKVIGVKDIGYTGMQGIQELVEKSKDILAKEEIIEEKELVSRFFEVLNKRPSHAAYGREEILRALELGAVELLLISEDIQTDEAEMLSEKAEQSGSEWKIISTESREGEQLAAIGGLAAILRFPIS